jgi:catechol 2,3-dioxygenase-like lactoylglutathione lyase family enzyme
MYDHLGLKVRNLDASVKFYDAALGALGHVLASRDDAYAGLGPKGEPALWLYAARSAGGPRLRGDDVAAGIAAPGTHVAFRASDRKSVDRFHAAGLAAGGRDNGAPGLRADYSPTYYAAFLLDPDGNNVEAVCFAER